MAHARREAKASAAACASVLEEARRQHRDEAARTALETQHLQEQNRAAAEQARALLEQVAEKEEQVRACGRGSVCMNMHVCACVCVRANGSQILGRSMRASAHANGTHARQHAHCTHTRPRTQ